MMGGNVQLFDLQAFCSSVSCTMATFNKLDGLADAWDASPVLRARIRNIKRAVAEKPGEDQEEAAPGASVCKTVANLKYNKDLILPAAKIMKDVPHQVPCIEALCLQFTELYRTHGVCPSASALNDDAWSVRYLFGVLKGLTYKPQPPKDTCLLKSCFCFLFF